MAGAFQANAFQNNAFQVSGSIVGWFDEWDHPRLRHTMEELEARLARQNPNSSVNAKWWDDFGAAQRRIAEVAKRTAREDRRKILAKLAYDSAVARDTTIEIGAQAATEQHFRILTAALHEAATTDKIRRLGTFASLANTARDSLRRHLEDILERDDEEEIMLILTANH